MIKNDLAILGRTTLAVIIGVNIVSLAGCKNNLTSASEDVKTVHDESELETGTEIETETGIEIESESEIKNMTEIESEAETLTDISIDAVVIDTPRLPETGSKLNDFIPEKWEIIDSVELDYNKDGIADYVGVLETESVDSKASPRILFAIASDKADSYHLDFQDNNLIRRRDEGGVFGDPYMPMTAEGTSFTTHAYGGSAWRWSEDFTYTFRDNDWWCKSSTDTYGYMDYTVSYYENDWEKGTGIRKKRSDDFEVMEQNHDSEEYDVVYEIPLDKPFTLEQSGMRWWLTKEHITDWEVKTISFGEGTGLSEDMVKLPGDSYIDYCDEDCALYTFLANEFYYIAMYRWKDKELSVLAKENAEISDLEFYKGKIYYTISANSIDNNSAAEITGQDIPGVRLNRIEPDGSGKETVFEYLYENAQTDDTKESIPYMVLSYEIGRDEIVVEVYLGGSRLFYRMNTDGSEVREIGQM